jgi:cytochrome c oxidase subunit 4
MTIRSAVATYLALMTLLAITVGSTFVPLGIGNSLINLVVAAAKAVLIGIMFMHLRRSGRLIVLCVGALVCGLLLLYGLSLNDYATR